MPPPLGIIFISTGARALGSSGLKQALAGGGGAGIGLGVHAGRIAAAIEQLDLGLEVAVLVARDCLAVEPAGVGRRNIAVLGLRHLRRADERLHPFTREHRAAE